MVVAYLVKKILNENHFVFGVFLQITGRTIQMMKIITVIPMFMIVRECVMDFLRSIYILRMVMVMV